MKKAMLNLLALLVMTLIYFYCLRYMGLEVKWSFAMALMTANIDYGFSKIIKLLENLSEK
ncbi:hypothetical protein IL308_05630 [Lactococcus lactis]|uniref:hypothetical protein n=1 Tax=Lactococcus lactis TaxID=1358 RepID=UPI001911B3EC|nr:hypothetical protein [Lactococcus lactis]MBK5076272.1 hypothetical protein [Lactococcus lactis]